MAEAPVYIVHLRRPRPEDKGERRSDPFYEFGSFGCTGCHRRNLLNPKNDAALRGARLAFAQGGPLGFRLVHLTPLCRPRVWDDRVELRWSPAEMPFRYDSAPVLVGNALESDFPAIERLVRTAARSTIEACFSSRFRSRTTALDESVAAEVVETFERLRRSARPTSIATTYTDALPYLPPRPDDRRRATYRKLVAKRRAESGGGRKGC